MCVCALGIQAQPRDLPGTSAHTHVRAQVGVVGMPMQMAQCVHRADQANCYELDQAHVSLSTPRASQGSATSRHQTHHTPPPLPAHLVQGYIHLS